MKKIELYSWVATFFFICLLTSCDDELIEGQFIEGFDCLEMAEVGEMRAILDTINFNGNLTTAIAELVVHQNGFYHMNILATDTEHGLIYLGVNYPAVGVFDLATPNEGGFVFPGNNHFGLTNFGVFAQPGVDALFYESYSTFIDKGGAGELEITALDFNERTISGNFSFIANRLKKDPDTGEIILNENGEFIVENVEITCGNFNEVIFQPKDESGQPFYFSDFYAEIDGEEFMENNVVAATSLIGVNEYEVINIEAVTSSGRVLRIDIPLELEEGTFPFESISDGTKLTAIYNDNNGSEALTANPGSITIIEFDKVLGVIEASFSFTGTDPFENDPTMVEVTNGLLNLSFEIPSFSSYVTAEVDGIPYESRFVSLPESSVLGVNVVTIDTKSVDNRGLDLIIPTDIEIGSYDMTKYLIDGNEKVGLYTPEVGTISSHRSELGTLTILSNDISTGEIEGTFEFLATDVFEDDPLEYNITNGAFLIQLYD